MFLGVTDQTFTQEVLESYSPVLVSFWAPWCGLCRTIEPILNNFRSEYGTQVKFISINADENLKLASQYRLTTLPTLIFFHQGRVLHRIDSFHGRDDLRIELEQLVGQLMMQPGRI